jgi:putative restriction endonuclease
MIGTIANTDYGWYEFLSGRQLPEVNFWTPSARREFRAAPLSPFLFKLKAPYNAICGFGYFARWSSLPDWLAWECFGEGNGCRSLQQMRERIGTIRRRIGYERSGAEDNIGCILVVEPTFFPPEDWIIQPSDWHPRIVTSKSYDLTMGEGCWVWEECILRAPQPMLQAQVTPGSLVEQGARFGSPQLIRPRLGQGTFRVAVTEAYDRSCAVTGEHSLPVLEAAHIRPFADSGPHDVSNGILLRADIHRLFDRGYVTITPDYRFEVSGHLRTDYSNGSLYYPLAGLQLRLPYIQHERPAIDFIQYSPTTV